MRCYDCSVLITLLMVPAVSSCVRDPVSQGLGSPVSTRPGEGSLSWTASDIKARLGKLPPWPNEVRDFAPGEWLEIVTLAQALQQTAPETVRLAMKEYVDEALTGRPGEREPTAEWSKLFILLRVLFAVPSAPYDGHKSSIGPIGGGFMFGYEAVSDEEYERLSSLASAPIIWTKQGPRLFACLAGYNGKPYDVDYEWLQYRKHYGYRNLDETLRILRAKVAAETRAASRP